jgi:MFS family permease
VILRFGFYPAAMVGGASLLLGSVVLLGLSADTSIMVAVVAGLIIGLGMGFTTNATVISVQNAVDWGQRGIATALIQFFRTIGGSISVAVMGALLNSRMAARLAAMPGAPANGDADVLVNRAQRDELPPAVLDAMQHALSASLHEMFFIVFAAAALCLAAVSFFPKGRLTTLVSTRSETPRPAPALSEPSD